MKLTESQLRKIVRKEIQTLKESPRDNWSYAIHLDNLYQLKSVADEALFYSKKSPLGEDPELEEIVDAIGTLIDAVLPLVDY